MGQSQSTSDSDNAAPQDITTAKSDYYELLGVERTASEDELKKAYRRKALELHPDRNYGNVEETTKLFAEIQSAYEVLSDPQERAWYDSHRDVLLRGDAAGQDGEEYSYNVRMTTVDEVLKLMMKFNGRVEFNDSPSGFYGGLHDFFAKLAKEEDIACQWEGEEDRPEYPEFGAKSDEYEDLVRPFYAAWTGFATRKSYAWKDQYRLSDAPDRRIRRLMEKENRKLREEAVQEFNDAVRTLVAFVRKRDPRVQNNQKSEAERQKALRDATAAQAARARAARQAQNEELEGYGVPEWAQSRNRDENEGGFSSESDVEEHEYDCVVCDKTFKSEAQYKAHEKSKKHTKLLKQLKKEMRAEGHELNLDGKDETAETEIMNDRDDDDDDQGDTGLHTARDVTSHADPTPVNESDGDDEDVDHVSNPVSSVKSKPRSSANAARNSTATGFSSQEHIGKNGINNNNDGDEEDEEDEEEEEDSDYAPRSTVEQRLTSNISEPDSDIDSPASLPSKLQSTTLSDGQTSTENTAPSTSTANNANDSSDTTTTSGTQKLGKAKQKRLKRLAAQEDAVRRGAGEDGEIDGGGEFPCVTCGNGFPSKSQLFKHIKDKNHAAPLIQVKPGPAAARKGGGKGKKR